MLLHSKYLKFRKQSRIIRKRKQKILEHVSIQPDTVHEIAKSKSIPGNYEDKKIDCFEMIEDGKLIIRSYSPKLFDIGKHVVAPANLSQKELDEKMNPYIINEYQQVKLRGAMLELWLTVVKNPYACKSSAAQEWLRTHGEILGYSRLTAKKFEVAKRGKTLKKPPYEYYLKQENNQVSCWRDLPPIENHNHPAREIDERILEKFFMVYSMKASLIQTIINSKKKSVTAEEKSKILENQIHQHLMIIIDFKKFLEEHYPNTIDQKIPDQVYKEYSMLLDMCYFRDSYCYDILRWKKHSLHYRIRALLNHLENKDHQIKKEFDLKNKESIKKVIAELIYKNGMPNMRKILGFWWTELPLVPLLDVTPRSLLEELEKISKELFPEYEKSIQ